MPYWQLFYHVVWATEHRQPLLTQEAAPAVYDDIRRRAMLLGASIPAINGTEDHVHILATVPPKLALATFVGQIKSGSSARYNRQHAGAGNRFSWQEEYGVFTFDRSRLPDMIAYVANQRQRHADGATIPALERISGGPVEFVDQFDKTYVVESEAWRNEMLALDTTLGSG